MTPIKGDPLWFYKILGIHGDGANNSTVITDVIGHIVFPNGNAKISTDHYPPLTGKSSSIRLDGNGDFLSIIDSSEWVLGSENFLIRARVRFAGYANENGGEYRASIISQDEINNRSFAFTVFGTANSFDGLTFFGTEDTGSNYTVVNINYSIQLHTWYLFEVCRVNSLLFIIIDGQVINTNGTAFTRNIRDSGANLRIGALEYDATYKYYLNGYISEVEFYKGIVGPTESYTPSSDPFPDSYLALWGTTKDSNGNFASRRVRAYHHASGAYAGSTKSDAITGEWKINTIRKGPHFVISHADGMYDLTGKQLVLPLSGVNNSSEITDLLGSQVQPIGGAKIITNIADPFGNYDGILSVPMGGYLYAKRCMEGIGSGVSPFHIRFWAYITSISSGAVFVYGNNSYQLGQQGSGRLGLARAGVAWVVTGSQDPPLNTWVYIQVTRTSQGNINIYYNTTGVANGDSGLSFDPSSSCVLFNGYSGYFCDLEILTYIDNTTLPTARLPHNDNTAENALVYDHVIPY